MTERKEQPAELHITNQECELVKVGEIQIHSQTIPANTLAEIVLQMLKQKDVKEYLNSCEKKKLVGGYAG